ncbi:MAG: glucose-6-phosphate isomerase family protein [Candidatus Heimdallarchaeota archaeon]
MSNTNLSKFVPFELLLDNNSKKLGKAGDIELDFAVRKLFDMKEVIYDQNWVNQQENDFDLYYMYRDLTRKQDKTIYQKNNVRFDVTVIPPQTLGKELVKTAGHFHPDAKEGISFPEVYELMNGEGIYLLQKDSVENNTIEIIVVKAKAGDQILIPPGYGHITINPSKTETLVMNNLVSSALTRGSLSFAK